MKSHTAQNAEENSARHEQSSAFIVELIGTRSNFGAAKLQGPSPLTHPRGLSTINAAAPSPKTSGSHASACSRKWGEPWVMAGFFLAIGRSV